MRRRRWIASASILFALAAVAAVGGAGGLKTLGEERSVKVYEELLPGPAFDATDTSSDATTSGAGGAMTSYLHGGSPNRLGSASVPVRAYEPQGEEPWATLIWAHGGSFVRGTLDWPEADWAARAFAEAGMRVYSVDYALASESVKAPAPANDVASVVRAVAERHEGPLIVGGASAGAHLATEAALTQADAGRPSDALIMLYPTAHRVQRADSQIAQLTATLPETRRFDASRIAQMHAYYLGDGSETRETPGPATDAGAGPGTDMRTAGGADPRGYPTAPTVVGELPYERLRQLPPTVIINADADELRASGEQFAAQLRAAKVPVTITLQPGTVHGYLNRPEESDGARADARATIERFVAEVRAIHRE
ncbi:alpha/beta hydrolase [Leucobacter sp. W1153]|uniref:alpha/beta hydrolase n=1 Tax=Leucobacter sp. W1153 TaxID=3439064 RepID=UPI003F2AA2BF